MRISPRLSSVSRLVGPRPKPHVKIVQQIRLASSSSKDIDQEVDEKKSAQGESKKIDRQSDEYSLSATDDAVAGQSDVSFDASKTLSPEEAKDMAGRTLEMSPANREASVAATEVEYRAVTRAPPTTTKGNSKIKTKNTDIGEEPESRAFAGTDKRKPQSPQDVAAAKGRVQPGAR